MMIQIVAFLIQRFHNWQDCPIGLDLGVMLENEGFDEEQIGKSLFFIQLLNDQQDEFRQIQTHSPHATRVYYPEEWHCLSAEVLDFLHFLAHEQVLNFGQREWIIHALMHLPEEDMTLDAVKTLAALILWANHAPISPVLSEGWITKM